MQIRKSEIWVGIFILLTLISVLFACLYSIDITSVQSEPTYRIYATFDNIGGLRVHSPVRIGGVLIGRVANITLDEKTYMPHVVMDIKKRYSQIPNNSSLSIRTSGLLGEQYLSLNVGFEDSELGISTLKDGSIIHDTKSAMVLEDMISHFFYDSKSNGKKLNNTIAQCKSKSVSYRFLTR